MTNVSQTNREVIRKIASNQKAVYINGLVDYADTDKYIKLQKETIYDNMGNESENFRFYIDSDWDNRYQFYYKLINDIESGQIKEVIIYSPFLFEMISLYASHLISVMKKNNCALKIIVFEDSLFYEFVSNYFFDGNCHSYMWRTEIGAQELVDYSFMLQ